MKTSVTDAAVVEYARLIRAGVPPGKLFPVRMTDCDFTEHQRRVIREARTERKLALKKAKGVPQNESSGPAKAAETVLPVAPKAMTKLRKMLYLQSGRCFFCGQPLSEEDASIEHLNPKCRDGKRTEDNEVVCHATLNETFGDMDLKRKFEFVIRAAGKFRCPQT